jgi:hypothetical protein
MKHTAKKTLKRSKAQVLIAIVVVCGIAAIGIYLFTISHAQSPYVSTYAANGKLGGTATLVSGGSNSNKQAVQFGTPSTGGGGGGGGGTGSSNGCTSGGVVAPCIGGATTGASGWGSPTFDDEFTNDSSLNTTDWASSWFNGGSMNGVSTSASNVSVSGGVLNMELSSTSSGSLISSDPGGGAGTGFQFTYGFAEAEIDFPGSGSSIYNWPAFWTDGQSWPADGESDIAEGLGTLTSNYHSPQGANNSNTISGTWSNGYHTYGLDRTPGEDYIYWDGKLVRSYASDDGGAPEYLIFNVGTGNTTVTGSGSDMKVKYARVWQ